MRVISCHRIGTYKEKEGHGVFEAIYRAFDGKRHVVFSAKDEDAAEDLYALAVEACELDKNTREDQQ
jgi:hypothetical protein